MPADPLENATDSQPQPRRPKNITCSFCGSQLDSEGTYVRLGAEAKSFRDSGETIDRLKAEVKSLEGTIETLRGEIERLRAPIAPTDDPVPARARSLVL